MSDTRPSLSVTGETGAPLTDANGFALEREQPWPLAFERERPGPSMPRTPGYTAGDFGEVMLRLLPSGPIWPRHPGSVVHGVVHALAPSYARTSDAAGRLLQDSPAGAALDQLLPDWEATLGLPDPCAGLLQAVPARVRATRARLSGRGGQSVPYIVTTAAAIGSALIVNEYLPFRVGGSVGRPLYGEAWAHAWQAQAPAVVVEPFLVGQGRAGDPLATWGGTVLECLLARIKPAQTTVRVSYTNGLVVAELGSFTLGTNTLA